jgi:acetyl esterase/lipase
MQENRYEKVIPLWGGEAPGAITGEEQPTYTSYLLDPAKTRGCVVVLPGGGYGHRAIHEGDHIARWLNSFGVAAVVAHYRVKPYRFPVPLQDAQRTIRTVRFNAREWGIEKNKVAVLGFSAGGHLAATASTRYDLGIESDDPVDRESCRPDASVLCYPVISLSKPHGHLGSCDNLLGENFDTELRDELCAEIQVTGDTPPAFLWHTASDDGVPVENSLMYASALSANEVSFELHVFPEGRHGLGLAPGCQTVCQWTALCERWLRNMGYCG